MTRIREIFARNLKTHRKRTRFFTGTTGRKADVSAHYIAILEIARSFPTSEVLERIAGALNIEIYELLLVPESQKEELKNCGVQSSTK